MKNNYKIVIIDDDELAVDNLAFELKSYAGTRITELGPQRDHMEHASRLLYGLQ